MSKMYVACKCLTQYQYSPISLLKLLTDMCLKKGISMPDPDEKTNDCVFDF